MQYFYLMRHAQSVANAKGIAAGWDDSPLSDLGRNQAQAARSIFDALDTTPDVIYHSHLSRAQETAEIVTGGADLPMVAHQGLAERNFGDWGNTPFEDVIKQLDAGNVPEGSETFEDFQSRYTTALEEILNSAHQTPFVVTHGGVIFNLRKSITGEDVDDIRNCFIYKVGARGDVQDWSIECLS